MNLKFKIINRLFTVYLCLTLFTIIAKADTNEFNDSGWVPTYLENFDSTYTAVDGQTFGSNNWLIFQLLNNGAINIANGYAQLSAPDFFNAALIRSRHSLPSEYKLRTKIGYINYDLTNYEQADYDDPDFNTHGGKYENGMYFLTITNDTCVGDECAENWWHYHRKMVIDVDNHINTDGSQTYHPVYMVYMSPLLNSGGNLLRTWTGTYWDKSTWNWSVAYYYESDSWYYAELEKYNNQIILRLYDESKNLLEETEPVPLDSVFAMNHPLEFLYLGEPHTDDYEGDVRIDEITLLLPAESCCQGIRGNINNSPDQIIDITDLLFLVDYMFLPPGGAPVPTCLDETDINGDGEPIPDISDLLYLVDYMFLPPGSSPAPTNCD